MNILQHSANLPYRCLLPENVTQDTNRNVHTLSQYECYFHQFRIAYIELSVYHHKIIPKCIQMQIV